MKISAIIVSDVKTKALNNMVRNTINSLKESEKDLDIEIIVCEKQPKYKIKYVCDKIIPQDNIFNYNNELNKGIKASRIDTDLFLLLNNDIIFSDRWLSKIIHEMVRYPEMLSASPMSKDQGNIWHKDKTSEPKFGYEIRKHIAGFCIVVKKEVFDIIGELDTYHNFWRSDDIYGEQLQKHKIKHAIIPTSKINHLESITLRTLDRNKQYEYTHKELRKKKKVI
jgi:GT2 family glycosyltransferase